MARSDTFSHLQRRSWGYYGWPGSSERAVGEVRYVVGWHADQMTRLEWDVWIDGSDEWTVEFPKKNKNDPKEQPAKISTLRDDGEEDQTAASRELLELIGWDERAVRAVDTNLFVGGQGNYIKQSDGTWRVVSVLEPKRKETIDAAAVDVPFLWPHPADPTKPDAPLFGVLEILDELDWLSRQARSQSRQRVLTTGVILSADGFTGPNGETFWEMWNAAASAKMVDPDDNSPIRLQGPSDLVLNGFNWIVPPYEYDAVVDRRAVAAIQRLAYGLPIPPQVLTGIQAASRATAFQIEENGYRAHIEPPAEMVAQVPQDALEIILEDIETVEVKPNPSRLLSRLNSVEDVKWARNEGLVTPEYTREVLRIPEDAAPDPEIDGVPIGGAPADKDPSNVAADEPVTAAASPPDLSTLLADIDAHLSSELAGITVMAVDAARRRLGAKARTVEAVRNNGARDLNNAQLAAYLGFDGLTAAGVNVPGTISEPINAATEHWIRRVGEIWEQMAVLIPGWVGQGDWIEESVNELATALEAHIVDTLQDPDPGPLVAESIRDVVDAAAGGNSRGVR